MNATVRDSSRDPYARTLSFAFSFIPIVKDQAVFRGVVIDRLPHQVPHSADKGSRRKSMDEFTDDRKSTLPIAP